MDVSIIDKKEKLLSTIRSRSECYATILDFGIDTLLICVNDLSVQMYTFCDGTAMQNNEIRQRKETNNEVLANCF